MIFRLYNFTSAFCQKYKKKNEIEKENAIQCVFSSAFLLRVCLQERLQSFHLTPYALLSLLHLR